MDGSTWIIVGVALVMAIGLVGTLLPFVPGLPLIWAAAVGFGVSEGFGTAGWIAMILITLFMAVGIVAKVVLPQRRATAAGAPKTTLTFAALAAVVGFFVIPVVGLPLGAVAGVLVAEYRRTNDWSAAWRSTKQVVVGFGLGTLVEMGAGVAMIFCWVVWALVAV